MRPGTRFRQWLTWIDEDRVSNFSPCIVPTLVVHLSILGAKTHTLQFRIAAGGLDGGEMFVLVTLVRQDASLLDASVTQNAVYKLLILRN